MFIVEMCHRNWNEAGNASLDCSATVWKWCIDLGKRHGWTPAGVLPIGDQWTREPPFDATNYAPIYWGAEKGVTAADAAAWSAALKMAHAGGCMYPLPKGPFIISESGPFPHPANLSVGEKDLLEFIAFLDHGDFVYAYDD